MFQIICKSNDSLNYYPDNKANNFRVKILPLANKGYNNLEVGLVEIIIHCKIRNVRNGYNSIEITRIDALDAVVKYHIEPGSYSLTSLINEINQQIKSEKLIKFELNKKTNQAWIVKQQGLPILPFIEIRLGVDIAKILGFCSCEWIVLRTEQMPSSYQFGPQQDLSMLHVYSNVVKESHMGEFTHQLMRIVNWNQSGKDPNSIAIVYDRPYFIPVKHMNIDSIHIEIKDNLNIPVEFFYEDEPVIAILEFQEKKL